MKVIPTFPTEIFEFQNTELDNDSLIPLCEQYADHVKHTETISSMRNLHDKKENMFPKKCNSENLCF